MTSFTRSFEAVNAAHLAEVGGKGANLGELTQAGFNVPAGFCVTTAAFSQFMAGATEDIYGRLNSLTSDDLEQLRQVGNEIRTYLETIPLPSNVKKEIISSWQALGETEAYAVRSSATAEDLPYASFAGQQDTYLNIKGQSALIEKIKACFISLFTDRAILYRNQNGFDHQLVSLSVVVQKMVQPEVSGILFTAHPLSGHRQITSIDASFGLGEALVSGLVSADLYEVDKRSLAIIKRQIATKKLAIRSLPEGGTEQVELSSEEGQLAALSDSQIITLTKLGSQIETHYGTPQDIEWALVKGQFYIVQSRPITSLYPLPQPEPKDDTLHIYTSLSHFQVMTDAMPPLALSLMRTVVPIKREAGEIESTFVKTAGGRLYVDISNILKHPISRRGFLRGFRNADQLAASAVTELAKRPNIGADGRQISLLRLFSTVRHHIPKVFRTIVKENPDMVPDNILNVIDAYHAEAKTRLETTVDLQSRLKQAVTELQMTFTPIFSWAHYLFVGFLASGLVDRIMRQKSDPADLAALGRGLVGNVATEMNLAVGDLADLGRASEQLTAVLTNTAVDPQSRLIQAAEQPNGKPFIQAWQTFIDTYGARGPSEIDLSRPRWAEDPTSLLQMVINAMGHTERGSHRTHYQQLIEEGNQAVQTVTKRAYQGIWGWVRGPLVRRLIRISRHLLPIREHHKFHAIRLFSLIKPVFQEVGRCLCEERRLLVAKDVWFLSIPELIATLDDPTIELHKLVSQRKEAHKHFQKLTPPRVTTSDGEIPTFRHERGNAPEGALIGSPVSAGTVEGIAKVVLDPSKETLVPGEILVAPFTDPGWTPLFVSAAGLITEVGGLMTHGSLVAREYGIPAVVGVIDATKQIKTGQRIRIHGAAGYVEILE